jgi:hypothetical protein
MTDNVLNLLAFGFWISLLCAALAFAGLIGDAVRRQHEGKRRGRYDSDLAETVARRNDVRVSNDTRNC